MYIYRDSWGGILASKQELCRPYIREAADKSGKSESWRWRRRYFGGGFQWNSTVHHNRGALDWCDLHTPDSPLRRVTSAAAAFSDRQKFVGDLKQPAGFTSLQSSRPQGHIIWDRNRTGGSECSGTVEKTHFSWLLLSIKRRSFCHRPTTSQIKSEKSHFNREVLSEWPQSAAYGPKLLHCLKKSSYFNMCLFLVT